MCHVSDATQAERSQEHPRLVFPVTLILRFILACSAPIAPRVMAQATGLPHIAAHIPALQTRAVQASITDIPHVVPAIRTHCMTPPALPVTMVMAEMATVVVTTIR